MLYSCVQARQDGYSVLAVPPSLTIVNDGGDYKQATGWEAALDNCPDMADERRDYLKDQFRLLLDTPDAHAEKRGGPKFRPVKWL